MGDWIPIYSQTKVLVQLLAGDSDGAERTTVNFLRTCPIVSQTLSLVQLVNGNPEGARETFKQCYDTMGGVVNGIPVIGHIKGAVHYLAKDNEGGDAAMKAASHSTAVTVGGAMGMAVAGPAGAVTVGIAAGTYMDATITIADSIIHNEKRMYGFYDTLEKIETGTMTSGDVVDSFAGLVFDGMAAYAGGKAYNKYKKCKQTNKSAPKSNTVAESRYEYYEQTKKSAPKNKTVTNSKFQHNKQTPKSKIVPEINYGKNKGYVPKKIIQTIQTAPAVIPAFETIKEAQLLTQPVEFSDAGTFENKDTRGKTRPSDSSNTGKIDEKGVRAKTRPSDSSNTEQTDEKGAKPKTRPSDSSNTEQTDDKANCAKPKTRPSDSSNTEQTDEKGAKPKTRPSDSSNTEQTDDKGAKPKTRPSDSSNTEQTDEKGEKAKTGPSDSSNTEQTDEKDCKSRNGQNRRSSSKMRSSKRTENEDINVPLEAPFAVKVKSIKDLRRGMHIKWERKIGYTHHALVTDINTDTNQIEVIHFTSANSKNECNINAKAIIKQEWLHFDSENLLRLEYNCRLSPENAIEKATEALSLSNEQLLKKYHLGKNNCEHLITDFVTGNHHSFQIEALKGTAAALFACGLSTKSNSKRKKRSSYTEKEEEFPKKSYTIYQ